MAWMKEPVGSWPYKKSFSPVPEELRKDMMEDVCNVLKGTNEPPAMGVPFPSVKRGDIDRLLKVYGYVVAAVYKWRKRQKPEDLFSSTVLRAGSGKLGIRRQSANELGNCTCLSWPRKGWEFQVQKCWP
jgi:hypothetical protein